MLLLFTLVFGATLAVYSTTLAPTVTFIDSGELAAVSSTLGIAHPTGYPLFTLLGWCFTKLPIAGTEIARLNVLAMLLTALGASLFFRTLVAIQRYSLSESRSSGTAPVLASSLFAAFILGFSRTYWSQSTAVEVYALHCVFLSGILFLVVVALRFRNQMRWWSLLGFALGLSFTNHMTTVLVVPGILFLFLTEYWKQPQLLKRIGSVLSAFLVGVSLYLYLPLRAASDPLLNWGNPETLERFFWHVSGKQYRVWIFSSVENAARQLRYFTEQLPSEFAYVPLILAILGIWVLLTWNRRWQW